MQRPTYRKTVAVLLSSATLMFPLCGAADPPVQPILLTIPDLGLTASISEYDLDTSFESTTFNAKLTVERIFDADSSKFWNAYFSSGGPYDNVTVVSGGLTWRLNGVSILAASTSATESRQGLNTEEFEFGVAGQVVFNFVGN